MPTHMTITSPLFCLHTPWWQYYATIDCHTFMINKDICTFFHSVVVIGALVPFDFRLDIVLGKGLGVLCIVIFIHV